MNADSQIFGFTPGPPSYPFCIFPYPPLQEMSTVYHSETLNWSSDPKQGRTHGTKNIVNIKDGKGVKIAIALDASGKPIQTKKKTLKAAEIKNIVKGSFVPGLWNNCKTANCSKNRKTRKMRKTKESSKE